MTYLFIIHCVTAGQNGPMLGSDEQEIVLIMYMVIDTLHHKVVVFRTFYVKPRTADINENVLSEQCRGEYALSEGQIKSGNPLEVVVEQFDALVRAKQQPDRPFIPITDGQLHLRQCLHPEASAKDITLPPYYFNFFDIRKEFRKFYNHDEVHHIKEMMNYLHLDADLGTPDPGRHVHDLAKVIIKMLQDGHKFHLPEVVDTRLEPGICSKNEKVDSNCVVRARGLPWQSSDQDIAKFFRGLNIEKGGVALCLSAQGRRNGEALVRFSNQEHRDMALKRNKHHIGTRYIEVYRANGEDFVNVAGGNNNEAQAFLSRGGQVIVRMRGLPYDCSAKQVVDFFKQGEKSKACEVLDGEQGVLFVKKLDGRATGDAFVMFMSEEDCPNALSKHREVIGTRYIELFRSTTAEVQQVLNRTMDPRTYDSNTPLINQLPPTVGVLPPPSPLIACSNRKDCIRLRGLPYEAQVENILEFLGEHSKNIAYQGVHMVFNQQGQPSGEALVQMNSEETACSAAQAKHHQNMASGKKQRYIEVFQCSGEDMKLVLAGASALPTQGPLPLSPGMLPATWDPSSIANPLLQAKSSLVGAPSGFDLNSVAAMSVHPALRPQIPIVNTAPVMYPGIFPQHAAAAATLPHPLATPSATPGVYLLNVPRTATVPFPIHTQMPPPVSALHTPVTSTITAAGTTGAANATVPPPPIHKSPSALMAAAHLLPSVPPASMNSTAAPIGGKRSWDQAFPLTYDPATAVKRQWQQTALVAANSASTPTTPASLSYHIPTTWPQSITPLAQPPPHYQQQLYPTPTM